MTAIKRSRRLREGCIAVLLLGLGPQHPDRDSNWLITETVARRQCVTGAAHAGTRASAIRVATTPDGRASGRRVRRRKRLLRNHQHSAEQEGGARRRQ